MDEREELEQVPWQDLLVEAEPVDERRRAVYLGSGLIAAMLVGVVVARMWMAPSPTAPPVAPADEVGEVTDVEEIVIEELDGSLYSEADLMAMPTDSGERAAIAKAEWFVTDYFTADLEPTGAADVRSALPAGALSVYAQDGLEGISYVEWARAFHSESVGDGSYRVAVAFRTLAAPPDRGFMRQPVRAVEVLVTVRPGGGASVLDAPSPIALPAGPEPAEIPSAAAEPPGGVVDQAIAQASGWGSEPRVVSVHQMETEWRVVITVADSAGNRWPLVVRVSEA